MIAYNYEPATCSCTTSICSLCNVTGTPSALETTAPFERGFLHVLPREPEAFANRKERRRRAALARRGRA